MLSHLRVFLSRLLSVGLVTTVAACSGDSLVLPDEGEPAQITVVSGDGQTGPVGGKLARPLVVAVTDSRDRPVQNAPVVFSFPEGSSPGDVTPDTVRTNADGRAETEWELGPAAGAQSLEAGVVVDGSVSSQLTVTFGATAVAGSANRLVFKVQPSNVTVGVSISPAVQVEVRDANGNLVTGATDAVTIALGTNPGGGTLSGTATVNAVNGLATFSNLSIDKAGNGYALTASAGPSVTGAVSSAFNVNPGAAHHLEFTQQPVNTAAGQSFTVRVAVRDANGNTVTGSALSITVAIGDNPAGGTLSGTKTVAAVSGVATFSNLSIDKAGNDYTLTASGSGLSTIESDAFDVLPGNSNRLVFKVQPSNAVVGAPISPAIEVQVQDASGNPVLLATNEITLSSSVAGTLTGDNRENALLGVATFSNVAITKAGTGYVLTAFASGLASATSNAFDIAKANTTASITSKSPTGTSVVGQAVTVNYDVNIVAPGAGSLTGSVTVSDGTTSCTGGINAGSGAGSCQLTFSTPGARTLTATYSGDANFEGSASSGVNHTVNKAGTTTKIDSDDPDPSVAGEAVTVAWTVTVNTPGGGTPSGNVTITVNGSGASCSAAVAAGSCNITLPGAGNRTLTATYAGDGNFNGSSDNEPHTVLSATTTSVSSSANPSISGQSVTFTATVSPVSGGGTPDGSVQFTVDGTNLGSPVTLSGGSATISTSALTVGSHAVSAIYGGNSSFDGSTGMLSPDQVVNQANTPPTALDDTYSTPVDVALVMNAPGVLENDDDADAGDTLQAAFESGPSHGTLDLNADGSFTYTPESGFTGDDSFTYHATDGEDNSSAATVTITVGS